MNRIYIPQTELPTLRKVIPFIFQLICLRYICLIIKFTLHFDGNAIRVREYHWAIVQTTDEVNRPQGGVLAGKLHVVLDCLAHPALDAWMADSRKTVSGELLVRGPDGLRARTIRFTDAYCVNQGLFFDGMSNRQAGALSVLLSAHTLLIDQELEIRNVWPLDHATS